MPAGGVIITPEHIQQLVEIESQVHYGEPPPPGLKPFVVVGRDSPVLLSAPHGSRTLRSGVGWHQEEEYTAAMALLLSELCEVSVITTLWRTDDSDPNDTVESGSAYKRALRRIVQAEKTCVVIDLHGAGRNTDKMATGQLVDLGMGGYDRSLPAAAKSLLIERIERYLGSGVCDRGGKEGFPAGHANRIRAFCRRALRIYAVQIEMKPSTRVAKRRVDATSYYRRISEGGGPYSAPAEKVQGMLQALADFIVFMKVQPPTRPD